MYKNLENTAAPIPPAAAAKHVVTSVSEVNAGSAESTEPPLNPNHPNHNINTPAADRGILDSCYCLRITVFIKLPFSCSKEIDYN